MRWQIITSGANPRLKAAGKLRQSRQRRKLGLFLAEGRREVERALQAGLAVETIMLANAAEATHRPWVEALLSKTVDAAPASRDREAASPKPDLLLVEDRLFKPLCYRDEPEGILAVFVQPVIELDDLQVGEDALLLVTSGIAKPGNIGAMARSAAAAGAAAMILTDAVVDRFNPNAIRASTGAIFSLPVIETDRDVLLHWLVNHEFTIRPTLVDAAARYDDASWTGRQAIIIGPEDEGLDEAWRNPPDAAAAANWQPVRIDMAGQSGVDSLNASITAAIILFEAKRQREHGS